MMNLQIDLYEPEEMLEAAKFLATMAGMRQKMKDSQRGVRYEEEATPLPKIEEQAAPSPSAPAADSSSEPETTVTGAAPIEQPHAKKRGRPRKNTEAGGAAPTEAESPAPADPASVPEVQELTVTDVIHAADRFKNRVGVAESARLLKEKFLPTHKLASFAAVRDRSDLWAQFIEFCDTVTA